MTHTPGPWALDGDINAMNLDVVSGEGRIAMIDCENDDLTDAEVVANARLMRAAPDLLEALSDIILSSDANCGDSLANAIEAARNAIEKAKGL